MTYKLIFVTLYVFLYFAFLPQQNSYSQETYNIAVLDLVPNGVSLVEAKVLSEKIRSRISWIVNTDTYTKNKNTEKYIIVERTQMDKILDQFDIQNIGCVTDECAVEFGKMLQVDRIVIGSVNLLGRTYNITTRMVDVETGKNLHTSEIDHKGYIDELMGSIFNDVADELILDYKYEDWINSEYISINGNPEEAEVFLNGKKIGETPIFNKMVSLGNNSIKIKRTGYENYNERFNIIKGKPFNLDYYLIPKTRIKAFMKSLLLPGSGQRYSEYKSKGNLISILQISTIVGAIGMTAMSLNAKKEYDDAQEAYEKATSQIIIDKAYKDMNDRYDKSSIAHNLQLISIGAVAAVYLYNIFDAAVNEPKFEDNTIFNSMQIKPEVRKELLGISASLRF